ncbi:His Kinase A (phospho-acceptor) domain-containing protein [Dyadobacter sp. SG02]|uniref:ATP-binding protein n=1 Tax=Dyadobacter sp. SG02 TaxID=1855291 RepID=UPI0008B2F6A0|nr:ATP-binding protein [Dyadobacter sp. SG02]SEJ02463.1 His Kinase A (phospho-acceptor) domain-containing protein [Dyadobacter sp. SG02]
MRVRTLVIYITIGFVAAVLALVAVQYMTRRNLEELITANENLLDEYRMSSGLSHQADSTSRATLTRKMDVVDQSGQRVLRWNLYLTVGVLALLTAVFAIIIGRMKKQAELIGKLNVSERKLKEAVLVKENFLANMSHEIRTPLNAILGYTNLLQKKKLDPDTRLHISTVQQSGETLLAIVNDILDLSKIESGMMRIEQVPFGPEALVHSVATMFHHRSAEKQVPLVVTFDPAIPETITGDPTRLTQILVNLVSNAFKFTEKGEVNLRVNRNGGDGDRVQLTFEVTDTGIGIENERLETIFERFRQAEDSTTRHFGGTGLGLSIVRDLVHLQDGHISLSSEPGMGTSVKVTIPYRIAVVGDSLPTDARMDDVHPQRPGLRVLIVEDHIINQGLMMRLLEERRIVSRVAANGHEAIEILRHQPFDLVFMDIQMPGMDGYTATRIIREELKLAIPVIAMTAHAMEGEKEKCIRLGMDDHIAKPVRESELDRILTHFTKNIPANGSVANAFRVIDLDYMRGISNGDAVYEKLVTEQFLHLMPRELEALSAATGKRDPGEIRRIAHGIKTTISIMGLNTLLDEPLDVLESETIRPEDIAEPVERVLSICKEALGEAGIFYRQFQKE